MSMKNSNDSIGNRTRDLPACSVVPQPTVPPRAPMFYPTMFNLGRISLSIQFIIIYFLLIHLIFSVFLSCYVVPPSVYY